MKRCSKCKHHKDKSEFYRDKSQKDGLQSQCKECLKKTQDKYVSSNREKVREWNRRYYHANREEVLEQQASYYKENREEIISKKIERQQSDPVHLMRKNLRIRLFHAIERGCKSGSAVSDLGISIPDFKIHIESIWLPGMTWENWGRDGWHLDHIYPMAKADLADRAQFLAVCNWRNYQPMWAADNKSKGDTVTAEAQELFDRLVLQFLKELAA